MSRVGLRQELSGHHGHLVSTSPSVVMRHLSPEAVVGRLQSLCDLGPQSVYDDASLVLLADNPLYTQQASGGGCGVGLCHGGDVPPAVEDPVDHGEVER